MSPANRKLVYDKMLETLCKIHRADPQKAGLASYGKPGESQRYLFNVVCVVIKPPYNKIHISVVLC